jgi:putative sterol carrier protein
MVDKEKVKALKERMEGGAENATVEDIPLVWDFFVDLANENEEIQDEIADANVRVQMVLTDADNKYWLRVEEGKMSWGEGTIDDPTFTFSAAKKIGIGMLFGEVDATSAYMAGDITVEGNLQDAMFFQEIIELSMEIFEDLADEL